MHTRPFRQGDQDQIIDLLLTCRSEGHVTRYPTLWRMRLLLDSRVWDFEQDVKLWEDDAHRLVGCALLWKRQRDGIYYALERIVHPEVLETDLASVMVEWALERTAADSTQRDTKLSLSVFPLHQALDRDVLMLEAHGILRSSADFNVYMSITLDARLEPLNLPDAFQLLSLTEADLEAYQTVYGFTPVTLEYQRALLRNPEYQHWVVKGPDGQLAAYLECSFSRAEWERNSTRAGWIDYVETQPQYQHLKLGQGLMMAAFDWMRTQGANTVMLITRDDNHPAQSLFKKVGMAHDGDEYMYEKAIDPRMTP